MAIKKVVIRGLSCAQYRFGNFFLKLKFIRLGVRLILSGIVLMLLTSLKVCFDSRLIKYGPETTKVVGDLETSFW